MCLSPKSCRCCSGADSIAGSTTARHSDRTLACRGRTSLVATIAKARRWRRSANRLEHRLTQTDATRIADELRSHPIHDVADSDPLLTIGATKRAAPAGMTERLGMRPECCSGTQPDARAPFAVAKQLVGSRMPNLTHAIDAIRRDNSDAVDFAAVCHSAVNPSKATGRCLSIARGDLRCAPRPAVGIKLIHSWIRHGTPRKFGWRRTRRSGERDHLGCARILIFRQTDVEISVERPSDGIAHEAAGVLA